MTEPWPIVKKILVDTLPTLPTLVGLISIASFAFAFMHEWGYFSVIGIQFQAFVSTTDYLGNSIIWIPGATVLVLGALLSMRFGQMLGVKTADQIIKRRMKYISRPRRVGEFLADHAPLIVVLISAVAILLFFDLIPGFFMLAVIIFVEFIDLFIRSDTSNKLHIKLTVYTLIPPILIVVLVGFSSGKFEAISAISSFNDVYFVHEKDTSEPPRNVIVLRALDRGLLVHSVRENRVEIIRWETIGSVAKADYDARGYTLPACRAIPSVCNWLTSWFAPMTEP